MKTMEIVKMLFLAYIALIVLFNAVTVPVIALPGAQLLISFIFICAILLLVFSIHTKRAIVWWSLFLLSILGMLRPILEYAFSRQVPYAAWNFFPTITPVFGLVGFLIMAAAFIVMLDRKTMKEFSVQ